MRWHAIATLPGLDTLGGGDGEDDGQSRQTVYLEKVDTLCLCSDLHFLAKLMDKRLKILFAAGPVDAVKTHSHWIKGEDDPSHVALIYAAQFLDVCRDLDAQGYVISSRGSRRQIVRDEQFVIEHRPIPFEKQSAPLYQIGQLWYGLWLIWTILRFRADVAVITQGRTYWFFLMVLPWLGVRVIPTIHCVLWCKYLSPSRGQQLFLNLSRRFFTHSCDAILAVSEDIADQVKQLTEGQHKPILKFLPTYRRSQFADIRPPDEVRSPFRVLFVGRMEVSKGIYTVLEIAKSLKQAGRHDITFDLCGRGSELEALQQAAQVAQVEDILVCHGHCNKGQMREMFSQSHVVIVPTTKSFLEGFNKVVAEGVLAGRPVVTSDVCPALSSLRDAVVEVPPDAMEGYQQALLRLCDDREFYEAQRQRCLTLQEQFYDSSQGWNAKLKAALKMTPLASPKVWTSQPPQAGVHPSKP